MGQSKSTFKQLLEQTAKFNRDSLMTKARTANRVAKTIRGKSRQRTYDIKIKALQALVAKFGNEVLIRKDFRTPAMVVVAVLNTGFGLHAPKECFR